MKKYLLFSMFIVASSSYRCCTSFLGTKNFNRGIDDNYLDVSKQSKRVFKNIAKIEYMDSLIIEIGVITNIISLFDDC